LDEKTFSNTGGFFERKLGTGVEKGMKLHRKKQKTSKGAISMQKNAKIQCRPCDFSSICY
jgi:hypothetical protein